jgi:hypothetical protein
MLADLMADFPQANLAVVGDGPDRRRLETRFAGTQTVFTGYLRGAELASAYGSADLFVYASETETMGNVVLEAMSAGLPVLAPAAGGIPSLVTDGQSGLLYRPGDLASARQSLAKLLADPDLRRRLGARARQCTLGCRWEDSLAEVRRHYLDAISHFQSTAEPAQRVPRSASGMVRSLVTAFRCGGQLRQAVCGEPGRSFVRPLQAIASKEIPGCGPGLPVETDRAGAIRLPANPPNSQEGQSHEPWTSQNTHHLHQ